MNEVTLFSILFASVGLLFVGISIPPVLGKVPPNRYYGFRTKKTLSDPKIWYEANRLAGHDLLIAGAVITASSLAMAVVGRGWEPGHAVFTLLAVMVLSLTGGLWRGHKTLSRM